MTVRDLIKSSLRLIGAIATGEAVPADEQADALLVLNGMLGSWSNQGLLINATVREALTLTAGQQSYTMGLTGDFDSARPVQILRAGIQTISDNIETPISILNYQQWSEISNKELQSTPSKIYAEGTSPFETINVWPIPSEQIELILYSLKPLTNFTNADDDLEFPPGYDEALRYNLAIRLAPEFGKSVTQEIANIANESLTAIKRSNTKPIYMTSDAYGMTSGSRKTFNILTGV